jgi:peptidoglycan/xylan/chitin deacetylase (PgdA/CDA1 family)
MREHASVRLRLRQILVSALGRLPAVAGHSVGGGHGRATTIVSLTFDDGSADQDLIPALLASHGMRGTFYVNSGNIGKSGWLTWDQLRELAGDGNEVGGHTLDHVRLTTVTPAEARRQVCDDRRALLARGFEATSFAYPYGESNSAVEEIVRESGYSSGRRAWGLRSAANCPRCPHAERVPPADAYRIKTSDNPTSDMSLSTIKRFIAEAEKRGGGWVTLVFHHIDDASQAYSTTQADLAALLAWLQPRSTRGTIVQTVREVIGGAVGPVPAGG